ncbi:ligase-associated DNA damage response endonuclease PdeM [Humitalea sp. 24SJ18S-53]|uniref:ligase-associated DNA damage response endonuclease PdeM n=1 Tax=Humitalea sp. 24SJ18S-53 TaxID=3422307 RepID=UPI003D670107
MIPAPLHIAGERLALDHGGALAWPARRLLAVADLHLEKGSAFAARGRLLPPYDTRDTLARLTPLLRRWKPQTLVLLGDSFHDSDGSARMAPADRAALVAMLAGIDVIWVLGNHDPAAPHDLPGVSVPEHRDGPLVFRHIAQAGASAEISGHFHPKASLETRAGAITRPCFLTDGRRVVLPAFGSFCGGLDIRDPALGALFPRGGRAFLLGRDRLHSFATGPLRALARPALTAAHNGPISGP